MLNQKVKKNKKHAQYGHAAIGAHIILWIKKLSTKKQVKCS